MSSEEHDWEGMRSGAMPEDWHEQNDPGYIPGGADKMAERILSQPDVVSQDGGDGWNMARDVDTGKRRLRKPSPIDGSSAPPSRVVRPSIPRSPWSTWPRRTP